jgi:hypothetical protein
MQARGMCSSHYHVWRKARIAATGELLGRSGNNNYDRLADLMPATHAELQAGSGLSLAGVGEAVQRMRAAEPQLAHIGEWQEPLEGVQGSRWRPIFHAGPGKDKTLTTARKHKAMMSSRARWRAAKRNKPRLTGLEAALFRKKSDQPMTITAKMLNQRRMILEALAKLAPQHTMGPAALGFVAFPETRFRTPQGAAFASGQHRRALEEDGLIVRDKGYTITTAGRALLEQLAATSQKGCQDEAAHA